MRPLQRWPRPRHRRAGRGCGPGQPACHLETEEARVGLLLCGRLRCTPATGLADAVTQDLLGGARPPGRGPWPPGDGRSLRQHQPRASGRCPPARGPGAGPGSDAADAQGLGRRGFGLRGGGLRRSEQVRQRPVSVLTTGGLSRKRFKNVWVK